MKWCLVVACFVLVGCESTKFDRPTFVGNTDYTSIGCTKELKTSLGADFKLNFYEAKSKRWLFYGKGQTTGDFNVFDQKINETGYVTLGLDF